MHCKPITVTWSLYGQSLRPAPEGEGILPYPLWGVPRGDAAAWRPETGPPGTAGPRREGLM